MKTSIRLGCFETNSSSTHVMTMCSKEDMEEWEKGELLYDTWNDKLVPATEVNLRNKHCLNWEEFDEWLDNSCYEYFEEKYTTNSNETVIAFGYYGENY